MIHTFGYHGWPAKKLIDHICTRDRILVDIRLSPKSRIWTWTNYSLMHELPGRYRWLADLGNRNYKGGPIEIAAMDRGIAAVEELVTTGHDLVLLCFCRSYDTCHRRVVAEALRERGHMVEELSL